MPDSFIAAFANARTDEAVDLAIVGAGAAGLFAAIWAGRTAQSRSGRRPVILALDGARRLGAKILVAGGGRCNVTHHHVDERDYCGSTGPAIRKVLRRFSVAETIEFFTAAGVPLKQEETGKLFPQSDSARSVLSALVHEATTVGCRLVHPARVTAIEPLTGVGTPVDTTGDGAGPPQSARAALRFRIHTDAGCWNARRVILATGGKSLPKSGSDGGGYRLATQLGHSLTVPLVPALVPLLLPADHWITELAGLTLPIEITLTTASGRRIASATGSMLCTHQGLSGPAILDISRHWLVARHHEADVRLTLSWLPGWSAEAVDQCLLNGRGGAHKTLRQLLPERLSRQLCGIAAAPCDGDLPREPRRRLVRAVTALPLPVTGDRGFTVAEATAGGVPLSEIRLETMESRIRPGLHFAGEMLDVDGRIGGFNFQWAWASGFVAGTAAIGQIHQDSGRLA